jgi:cell division initiation protein
MCGEALRTPKSINRSSSAPTRSPITGEKNRENTTFREQVQKFAAEAEILTQREKDLRDTLLAAQKITEEMKNNAQKEAELIIAEAEVRAENILADAENKLNQLRNDIQELRRQKTQFETSFRSLIESHNKMLSLHEE